jgi:hypothetical protein
MDLEGAASASLGLESRREDERATLCPQDRLRNKTEVHQVVYRAT